MICPNSNRRYIIKWMIANFHNMDMVKVEIAKAMGIQLVDNKWTVVDFNTIECDGCGINMMSIL